MAMRPSIMGVLTQARDRHKMNLALFENDLIENQEREMQAISAKTAYKDPSFYQNSHNCIVAHRRNNSSRSFRSWNGPPIQRRSSRFNSNCHIDRRIVGLCRTLCFGFFQS